MLPCTDRLQHLSDFSADSSGSFLRLYRDCLCLVGQRGTSPGRDTIRDGRAPCLGGSMVRELLEKLPVVGKNPESSGWGIYRCLVGTVITDPISRGWK